MKFSDRGCTLLKSGLEDIYEELAVRLKFKDAEMPRPSI